MGVNRNTWYLSLATIFLFSCSSSPVSSIVSENSSIFEGTGGSREALEESFSAKEATLESGELPSKEGEESSKETQMPSEIYRYSEIVSLGYDASNPNGVYAFLDNGEIIDFSLEPSDEHLIAFGRLGAFALAISTAKEQYNPGLDYKSGLDMADGSSHFFFVDSEGGLHPFLNSKAGDYPPSPISPFLPLRFPCKEGITIGDTYYAFAYDESEGELIKCLCTYRFEEGELQVTPYHEYTLQEGENDVLFLDEEGNLFFTRDYYLDSSLAKREYPIYVNGDYDFRLTWVYIKDCYISRLGYHAINEYGCEMFHYSDLNGVYDPEGHYDEERLFGVLSFDEGKEQTNVQTRLRRNLLYESPTDCYYAYDVLGKEYDREHIFMFKRVPKAGKEAEIRAVVEGKILFHRSGKLYTFNDEKGICVTDFVGQITTKPLLGMDRIGSSIEDVFNFSITDQGNLYFEAFSSDLTHYYGAVIDDEITWSTTPVESRCLITTLQPYLFV